MCCLWCIKWFFCELDLWCLLWWDWVSVWGWWGRCCWRRVFVNRRASLLSARWRRRSRECMDLKCLCCWCFVWVCGCWWLCLLRVWCCVSWGLSFDCWVGGRRARRRRWALDEVWLGVLCGVWIVGKIYVWCFCLWVIYWVGNEMEVWNWVVLFCLCF